MLQRAEPPSMAAHNLHNLLNLRKVLKAIVLSCVLGGSVCSAAPAAPAEEKIVFIRHAEKPAKGLGLLSCQGLNRALALPALLLSRFGKPDFIFAADPHEKKPDEDQDYNYVRPLLTVAPTAVQLGLPINAAFGYTDTEGLLQELAAPRYHRALVLVAWEHHKLEDMVRALLERLGGDAAQVPRWKGRDFDSMYVVTVRRTLDASADSTENSQKTGKGDTTVSFSVQHQQLDGQAAGCPGPATP